MAADDSARGDHGFDDVAFDELIKNLDGTAVDELVQHRADVSIKFVHAVFKLHHFRIVFLIRRDAIHPRLERKANSVNQMPKLFVAFSIFD